MTDIKRRERVLKALAHKQPDRTPTDFQATGEIWEKLFAYFKTDDMKSVLDHLHIDCAWVDPQVLRLAVKRDSEGLLIGWGGSRSRIVKNDYGAYEEIVRYATDGCNTIEEIDRALSLPDLLEWDFSSIKKACKQYDDRFLIGGFASAFYYPIQLRRMEDFFVDMALNPEIAHHIIKLCFDWHMSYHEKMLKAAGGRIDAMQIADDFATQLDLLISKDMFREFFKKPILEYVALAKSYGAVPYLHCCGSAYHLIEEFIEMGIEILDPVQTAARNMEPEKLKEEFGEKITFHGGGETQEIFPHGSAEEVRQNARYLSETLGKNGGYIMTSCHFLQPDVPIENILAFYEPENRQLGKY